jgi:DNA repair protein RadA/Sms
MKCSLCDEDLKPNMMRCENCGKWNIHEENDIPITILEGEAADGSITLDQVRSEDAHRIKSGPWDHMWGITKSLNKPEEAGIVQTSTTLIAGEPGAGKTTLLLQICSNVASNLKNSDEVLYIAAEQSLPEIKLTADRLKLKAGHRIRMIPAMGGTANIAAILRHRKPKLVVLDSLQGLCGQNESLQLEVCDIVKKYAVELKAPIIIVSQVTKDGQMAGLMMLQHHVDTTMTLFSDEEGIRIQEVTKNRFGRAFINQEYTLTEKGLEIYIREDEEDEEVNEDDEELEENDDE